MFSGEIPVKTEIEKKTGFEAKRGSKRVPNYVNLRVLKSPDQIIFDIN